MANQKFINSLKKEAQNVPPIWMMRQAGRYHPPYQEKRKSYSFIDLCKKPQLAAQVALDPVEDFDFDVSILFSDLLFPLEQLSMGLSYKSGPPTLEFQLQSHDDFKKLKVIESSETFYDFQANTLKFLIEKLPKDKTLLGFVGAPFTLYTYATEGAHKGNLVSSKQGLYDGRFQKFNEILLPELLMNIKVQLNAGADAICLFDTAVGELCFKDFKQFIVPVMRDIFKNIKSQFPDKKIIYYSKLTHLEYLKEIQSDELDVLGIDWRMNLVSALKELGNDYYIQGNIDPVWLHLSNNDLLKNLEILKKQVTESGVDLNRWIAGLGHGVLIETPEENVRSAVKFFQEISY